MRWMWHFEEKKMWFLRENLTRKIKAIKSHNFRQFSTFFFVELFILQKLIKLIAKFSIKHHQSVTRSENHNFKSLKLLCKISIKSCRNFLNEFPKSSVIDLLQNSQQKFVNLIENCKLKLHKKDETSLKGTAKVLL